jgi:mono/diheme cytochrome c family protein
LARKKEKSRATRRNPALPTLLISAIAMTSKQGNAGMNITPHFRQILTAGSAFAIITGGAVALAAAGRENCEPARWLGQTIKGDDSHNTPAAAARPQTAQGPMMGPRRGHGPGMGMGMDMGMGRGRGGMHRGNMIRHRHVMMNGLPAAYAGLTNPLSPDAGTIAAGRRLYEANCASCHGPKGRGDGEAGKELDPKPADIAFIIGRPIASDGFLMWTLTEGGEALGTAMPAFRDVLSERERWQIITYLRHGLGR